MIGVDFEDCYNSDSEIHQFDNRVLLKKKKKKKASVASLSCSNPLNQSLRGRFDIDWVQLAGNADHLTGPAN